MIYLNLWFQTEFIFSVLLRNSGQTYRNDQNGPGRQALQNLLTAAQTAREHYRTERSPKGRGKASSL